MKVISSTFFWFCSENSNCHNLIKEHCSVDGEFLHATLLMLGHQLPNAGAWELDHTPTYYYIRNCTHLASHRNRIIRGPDHFLFVWWCFLFWAVVGCFLGGFGMVLMCLGWFWRGDLHALALYQNSHMPSIQATLAFSMCHVKSHVAACLGFKHHDFPCSCGM